MADNYLEYAREDYEKRKAAWLRKKKLGKVASRTRQVNKPEDESL